jgi:hypothetical protein
MIATMLEIQTMHQYRDLVRKELIEDELLICAESKDHQTYTSWLDNKIYNACFDCGNKVQIGINTSEKIEKILNDLQ